jgi:hypothetical protein
LPGFRAAKRQSTVKQRGCTILALLYRRVGRLAHLDLAARSPETMVRRDGTLTIILSGLREFQQRLEFLIGAMLAYLAIVEITKRIFYMSVAKTRILRPTKQERIFNMGTWVTASGRFCCKSLFRVKNENYKDR